MKLCPYWSNNWRQLENLLFLICLTFAHTKQRIRFCWLKTGKHELPCKFFSFFWWWFSHGRSILSLWCFLLSSGNVAQVCVYEIHFYWWKLKDIFLGSFYMDRNMRMTYFYIVYCYCRCWCNETWRKILFYVMGCERFSFNFCCWKTSVLLLTGLMLSNYESVWMLIISMLMMIK